ncbi:MAG TPA: hypothetical protein VGM24_12765, partial [Puia sp.]
MSVKKATLVFFVFLSLLTFSLMLAPGHNGDMPFYIAAVFSRSGSTDAEALSRAKEVIRAEMPPGQAAAHINRLDQAEKNLLDFYRIKPLYISTVSVLHRMGIPFIPATLIPSLLSFFLIGCIVFSWSSRVFDPLPALVFSILLMLINPSIILSRLSSPDPLSNLFLFGCFYRIYFERDYRPTLLFLILSVFTRLDNIISVFILLTLMRKWPSRASKTRIPLTVYLPVILLTAVAALWINYYFEGNFWWYTRISYIRSFAAYGHQVLIYFLSLSESFFPALLLFCLLVIFKGRLKPGMKSARILISIGLILLVRFLMFPSFEERFQTA